MKKSGFKVKFFAILFIFVFVATLTITQNSEADGSGCCPANCAPGCYPTYPVGGKVIQGWCYPAGITDNCWSENCQCS